MSRRNPARLLAPLALVAVAVAFFSVITESGREAEQEAGPQPAATATATATETKEAGRGASRGRRTYTVKAGDTPSGIAEETGVSVEELMELNPDLDAQSLTVGDRIKLR